MISGPYSSARTSPVVRLVPRANFVSTGFGCASFFSTEISQVASSLSSFCVNFNLITTSHLFFHGVLGSCIFSKTSCNAFWDFSCNAPPANSAKSIWFIKIPFCAWLIVAIYKIDRSKLSFIKTDKGSYQLPSLCTQHKHWLHI